jgi:hypothetical protein
MAFTKPSRKPVIPSTTAEDAFINAGGRTAAEVEQEDADDTIPVTVRMPKSMVEEFDKRCRAMRDKPRRGTMIRRIVAKWMDNPYDV